MFGGSSKILRKYRRRTMVVTLPGGEVFQGALVGWDQVNLEFAMVKAYEPQSKKFIRAADGPLIVERRGAYMQPVSVVVDAAE